jgi:uncharacterized protein (UPF0332 family)
VRLETEAYLEKARQCLSNAHANLGIKLANDAGRNAYLAAFHAAQALIFERTGKVAKTHRGVQSEFARLAKDDPSIDKSFSVFLTQAYNLKAVADYETGPHSLLPPERAAAAIETAGVSLTPSAKFSPSPTWFSSFRELHRGSLLDARNVVEVRLFIRRCLRACFPVP